MSVAKVVTIIDREFRSGEKGGKSWSIAKVELDNGKTTNLFNPINEGDVVESFQKDGYTNWKKAEKGAYDRQASPTSGNTQVADTKLLEAIRAVYKLNTVIYQAITGNAYTPAPEQPRVVKTNETELPPLDAYGDLPFGEDSGVL